MFFSIVLYHSVANLIYAKRFSLLLIFLNLKIIIIMRMPFMEFIANGDLKFMIAILALMVLAILHFIRKIKNKENQLEFNKKLKRLSNWSLILAVCALFLGLMHSFYFISKAGGIAPNLLFQGLANTLIAPVFGTIVCIVISLLAIPFKKGKNI